MNNIYPIKIQSTINDNILGIGWDPTNYCNFKCRYCFENSNAATHSSPKDLNKIVDNFDHLMSHYEQVFGKNKFQFFVAGGEPTLWKDLAEFIKRIKMNHDVYFSLISNGSRTIRWWKENAHLIDNAHLTHHLDQGNVEHITEVADILHEAGSKTTVKVLMDKLYWNQGLLDIEYMKQMSEHDWFIMSERVIKDPLQKYTAEDEAYLKDDMKRMPNAKWFMKNRKLLREDMRRYDSVATLSDGETLKARPGAYYGKKWNNFNGWECDLGIERIYIGWTGEITGTCNAKLYGESQNYNILSTNFVEEFNPSPAPVICKVNGCWCMPETHISKRIL
jgi:MoaA/NifB/PqqE/SkfB family radical SAM enzyme